MVQVLIEPPSTKGDDYSIEYSLDATLLASTPPHACSTD